MLTITGLSVAYVLTIKLIIATTTFLFVRVVGFEPTALIKRMGVTVPHSFQLPHYSDK